MVISETVDEPISQEVRQLLHRVFLLKGQVKKLGRMSCIARDIARQ